MDYIKSNERVHKQFNELQKNYGQEYNFFFYLKEQDFFQNYGPMSLSYTEFLELKEQIVSLTDSKTYTKRSTPTGTRSLLRTPITSSTSFLTTTGI